MVKDPVFHKNYSRVMKKYEGGAAREVSDREAGKTQNTVLHPSLLESMLAKAGF